MHPPFVPPPATESAADAEPRAILRLAALAALGWWLVPTMLLPVLVAVSATQHREGRSLALGWAASAPVLAWWTVDDLTARFASGIRLDASMVWLLAPVAVALVMVLALAADVTPPRWAAWVFGGVSLVAGVLAIGLRPAVPTDALGRIGEPWSMRLSTLGSATFALPIAVLLVVALAVFRRRLPPDRLPITVAAVLLQGAASPVAAWWAMTFAE